MVIWLQMDILVTRYILSLSELAIEKILIYGGVFLIVFVILMIYFFKLRRETKRTEKKIEYAIEHGLHEPVSLHPVINPNSCIKSGACVKACPEHDVLGIRSGRGTVINGSRCIGHGACFHACPVEAISLFIGTEKRGVDLPHVSQSFESNVQGIYIAGELGGMGLIRNAVEQGSQAVRNIIATNRKSTNEFLDLIVVGAGPAGISATLEAKKNNLSVKTFEQDSLGGTVYTFPRSKIVMTSPMNLPLYGKIKLYETSKSELLELWESVIAKHQIEINCNLKVTKIGFQDEGFLVETSDGESYKTMNILLAIGRRGTPRKLGVKGEVQEKVAYRLIEPEEIKGKNILIVGGGDSAVESAMLLAEQNTVTLSYRKDAFGRIKANNLTKLNEHVDAKKIKVIYESNVTEIKAEDVDLVQHENKITIPNDLVYIFAGGELPTQFLEKVGIKITRKYGEAILKH